MTDVNDLFSVAGKTAVVTGGTRGIGEMIANGFIELGAKVYITSRKAEACAAIQEKLGARGFCEAVSFDLAERSGIDAFTAYLKERESSIDVLVNNAGASWGEPLESYPEAGWDRVMDLNVKSVFFLTQQLLPLLRASAKTSGSARVINIGSIDGLTVPRLQTYAYSASKAALHHMTRVLASALAADHINVNAIAPGPFMSKMTAFMLDDERSRSAVAATMPLGRIGAPDDIVGLTTFLASRASDYITGAVIPLDGGYADLR